MSRILLFLLFFAPFAQSATPNCVAKKSNTVVIVQCDDGTVTITDSSKGSVIV
ncbi:TPA: hypothetical protein KGK99_005307, partial [Escherichia coli]|nr:hypothetical protein [Escherichia coli]